MADQPANDPDGLLPPSGLSETVRPMMQGAKSAMPWRRLFPAVAVSLGLHLFLLPFVLRLPVEEAEEEVPRGHYISHPPQYFPPAPDFPLVQELASYRQSVQEEEEVAVPLDAVAPAEPAGTASGTDTPELLYADMISTLKHANRVLKTVVNENTAKAARPELKKIGAKFSQLAERGDKLGSPTPQEEKELEKYRTEVHAVAAVFDQEVMRVSEVAYGWGLIELFPNSK
jgi:hypothetical protein